MAAVLKALGLDGVSTLVTTARHDPHVYLSARNITRVTVSPVAELNALSILKPRRVLMTREALDVIQQRVPSHSAEAALNTTSGEENAS
jgi:large subunit ribosomal protein L4